MIFGVLNHVQPTAAMQEQEQISRYLSQIHNRHVYKTRATSTIVGFHSDVILLFTTSSRQNAHIPPKFPIKSAYLRISH